MIFDPNIFFLELNETVICTNDYMEIIIPSAFFLNKMPPVYVSKHQLSILLNHVQHTYLRM